MPTKLGDGHFRLSYKRLRKSSKPNRIAVA
jgi:hypothetical protein